MLLLLLPQPDLLQIQVAIDPSQRLVGDPALVAKIERGLALHVDELQAQIAVRGLSIRALWLVRLAGTGLVVVRAIDVVLSQVLEGFARAAVLASELIQARDSGLRGLYPGARRLRRQSVVAPKTEPP